MDKEISSKLDEIHDIVITMKKCMDKLETIKPINYYENETKEIMQQLAKEQVKITVLLGHTITHLSNKLDTVSELLEKNQAKRKSKK